MYTHSSLWQEQAATPSTLKGGTRASTADAKNTAAKGMIKSHGTDGVYTSPQGRLPGGVLPAEGLPLFSPVFACFPLSLSFLCPRKLPLL